MHLTTPSTTNEVTLYIQTLHMNSNLVMEKFNTGSYWMYLWRFLDEYFKLTNIKGWLTELLV